MSDSESEDSDEGIRYKTESVRYKKEIEYINRHYKDQTTGIYRKEYLTSPSPQRNIFKTSSKDKKKRKKRSSGRTSSSSSSDDKSKRKSIKKASEQENKNKSHLISGTHSPLINYGKQIIEREVIGPALPPHLLDKKNENPDCHITKYNEDSCGESSKHQSRRESKNEMEDNCSVLQQSSPSIGPKLPPHMITNKSEYVIGPSLPANFGIGNDVIEQDTIPIQSPSYIGPQLPPHLLNSNKNKISELEQGNNTSQVLDSQLSKENTQIKVIGPSLPPHLQMYHLQEVKEPSTETSMEVGEEEDIYGPLPAGTSNYSSSYKALEERALQLKIDRLKPQGSNEPVRESWMLELPVAKAENYGLGPRTFRSKPGPDLSDRSSWTDLPGDRNKKKTGDAPLDLKAEAEMKELRKRDREQEMLTKKHRRNEKSLVKMHKEKLEKEKKNDGPSERRPFSRDIDLQVNRFDEAQKKAIMKKAQLLDNRFSSGKSKYL